MKKKNLIWTLGILIGMALEFTACTNDDEGGDIAGDAATLILGTWDAYKNYCYRVSTTARKRYTTIPMPATAFSIPTGQAKKTA